MPKLSVKNIVNQEEKEVLKKLAEIDQKLTKMGYKEYVEYLNSTKKLLWTNFLVGIMRGFGLIVGATVVAALVTIVVSYLVGLPIIGQWFGWLGDILSKKTF